MTDIRKQKNRRSRYERDRNKRKNRASPEYKAYTYTDNEWKHTHNFRNWNKAFEFVSCIEASRKRGECTDSDILIIESRTGDIVRRITGSSSNEVMSLRDAVQR